MSIFTTKSMNVAGRLPFHDLFRYAQKVHRREGDPAWPNGRRLVLPRCVSGADPIEARPDSLVAWRIAGAVLPDFHLVENRVLG